MDYLRKSSKQSELQTVQNDIISTTSQRLLMGSVALHLTGGERDKGILASKYEAVRRRTKATALLGAVCSSLIACTPNAHQPPSPQSERTLLINPQEIQPEFSHLPVAIKQDTLAVNKESVRAATEVFYGSGIFVHYDGKIRALTAAHLLADAHCVNSIIHANTPFPHSDYFVERQGGASPQSGLDATIQNLVHDSGLQDIALPASVIPDKPLGDLRGSIGFSISFEPTATGTTRTPRSPDPYSAPAEFDEVIVGEDSNDYFAVDGIGASYGHEWDNTGRPGESGGPVFTADGQHIIGLSVKGTTMSATDILAEFGVQLPNTSQRYHLSIIQPIDGDIMHRLDVAVDAAPLCT